ncbi:MAG: uroporphyrinogen-III C-methyltransferase [Gammaproteobacteria bacterium]|jgi:uroporphyrin-3 C-methyltransferase
MSDERPEAGSGDAAEDDTVSMPAISPEADPSAETRSRGSLTSLIALVAALAAFACSGVLLWQYRQFYVTLADADSEAQAGLERVRAAARGAENTMEQLSGTVDRNTLALRDVNARLDVLPGQFAELQRRIDNLQGGSFDVRNQWLEAEAEYYLSLANAELQLGGHWDTALAALRLADDRLRETGDPALAPVRELIADDILAVESVRLVDIEGLAYSLSRLGGRVSQLPLRAGPQSLGSDATDPESGEPGLGRLWSSIRDAFTSIVRVERRDEPIVAALTAEETRLIRRQLSVELQTARLALVSAQQEMFSASLEHAATLLREDFDVDAPDVEGGLRLLESLLELDVDPATPDISRSLNALRARGEP